MSTTTPRHRFTVEAVTARQYTTVQAANWLEALGDALAAWDREDAISRLACERLAPGTVLARDVQSEERYVVLDAELDDDITAVGATDGDPLDDVTWSEDITSVAVPRAARSVLGPLLLGGVLGLAVVALFVGAAAVSGTAAAASPTHEEVVR